MTPEYLKSVCNDFGLHVCAIYETSATVPDKFKVGDPDDPKRFIYLNYKMLPKYEDASILARIANLQETHL